MKKIICFFVSAIAFYSLPAQIQVDKSKLKNNQGLPANNRDIHINNVVDNRVMDIELYELPKFNGTKGYFTLVDGKLVAPFKLKNVSFKVPAGKIVYIKMCDVEFPYELPFSTSQSDINLTGICGIRSDNAATFTVQFNGISTVIHNNDCKRVFGTVNVKVMEQSATGNPINFNCVARDAYKGDAITFKAFSNANASTTPPYTNYVFDAVRSVPVISTVVAGAGVGTDQASFTVGATALRDGKVSLVITSKIGSAHKTCDLCDDFSSNVVMAAPVTETVNINRAGTRMADASHPKVVMGPYHAHGSRDGSAITASAGTDLDFRAHFTVTGL